MDEPTWTLRELTAEVAAQLARNYQAGDNGQVRAIPDERSIRYYTTIGLLDRPVAMRGRTALYGRRHLAQLVAVKRLQALGKSLAEIQQLVQQVDNATLSRISGVVLPREERSREQRASFWRGEPAAVAADDAVAPEPAPAPAVAPPPASEAAGFIPSWTLSLTPSTLLTFFAVGRPPTEEDAAALVAAAAPLLAELARRGLADHDPDPDPDRDA